MDSRSLLGNLAAGGLAVTGLTGSAVPSGKRSIGADHEPGKLFQTPVDKS